MLFNLKKKTSPRLTLPKTFGSVKSPFDPLTLPTYQAGYLMNLTNQVPSGSINHTALTQWFDAVLLNITGKYFQANIDITVPETINGLQAFGFTGATDQAYNTLFDVFNGVSNYTQLIGFRKAASASGGVLFYRSNAAQTNESWIYLNSAGKINIFMGDGHGGTNNGINLNSVLSYDDNSPHIIVAQYNQTTKSVDLFTDLGEHLSVSNVLFNPGSMAAGSQFDVILGKWYNGSLTFNPGLFADMFLYSSILSIADINKLMIYEADRIGIKHFVPF